MADAFCHSMVRALVGALIAVGEGRRPSRLAGRRAGCTHPRGELELSSGTRAHARRGRLPARGRTCRQGRAGSPGADDSRRYERGSLGSCRRARMSDHYFSAEPHSNERRQPVSLSVWGHDLELDSASGVFAAGRLDIGTSVLLREAQPGGGHWRAAGPRMRLRRDRLRSRGRGTAGPGLGRRRQRACPRSSAATTPPVSASPTGSRATTPDDVPADLEFAEIWSNPPIRIGKPALHELLSTWLPRLAPDGRAVLVVGKNLGADSLQRWIGEQGFRLHARRARPRAFESSRSPRPMASRGAT